MQSYQAWANESEIDEAMSPHQPEPSTLGATARSSPADREADLRPALLASYGNLSKLRYDYPLVLVEGDDDAVRSLSGVIDGVLQEIAPRGMAGGRLRAHLLALEEEIRGLVSQGTQGSLSRLWDLAAETLRARADDGAESLRDSLSRARDALGVDGEVIDCDRAAPSKLLTHLWHAAQTEKAREFRARLDRLVYKLSGILRTDFMKSREGRSAEALRLSVGNAYEESFDFEAMSRLLGDALPNDSLPESRRRRIRDTLSVLETQKFFAPVKDGEPHGFVFDACGAALQAFEDRLPELLALVKAVAVADLEIDNRYRESTHDPIFARFDESALRAEDLAPFPSYLVCVRDGDDAAAKAIEMLAAGLPLKILVQSDDIVPDLSIAAGRLRFGVKASQLASVALGLSDAFVLQASGSHLYQLRDRIRRGMACRGPALFSIFSGATGDTVLPPYLVAAAAMESRAFPAFTYDPSAGADWASRFRVDDNPQADRDWPSHRFSYEDEDLQGMSEDLAFTFVDFAACDARYAASFTRVPRDAWHADMVPASEALGGEAEEKAPYVVMVDASNFLHRAVVDDRLVDAARRCRDAWHGLQELGGINNSHAARLLAQEREVWEASARAAPEAPPAHETVAPEAPAPAPPSEEAPPVEEAAEAPSDEPYIETPRCTTCNECTEINDRMFAYDENMQAYIADPDAGTFRELVEAAESCQVAIIHPGKPRNPSEPNLDELIKRAEPFQA